MQIFVLDMECGKNDYDHIRDHAIKWTSTKKQMPANQSFAFIDVRTDSQFVQFAQSNSDVSKLICSHYIVVKLQTKEKFFSQNNLHNRNLFSTINLNYCQKRWKKRERTHRLISPRSRMRWQASVWARTSTNRYNNGLRDVRLHFNRMEYNTCSDYATISIKVIIWYSFLFVDFCMESACFASALLHSTPHPYRRYKLK